MRKKKVNLNMELNVSKKLPIFGRKLDDVCQETMFADKLLIPAIVREITLYLEYSGAIDEIGIYRISGIKSKIDKLKSSYDNDIHVNLHEFENHVLASTLKMYFRMLPDPIFPLNEQITDLKEVETYLKAIPLSHFQTLNWLISHLKNVSLKSDNNKMNITNIAIVFCPTLKIKNEIFIHLVQNYDRVFPDIRCSSQKISTNNKDNDFFSIKDSINKTNLQSRVSTDYDELENTKDNVALYFSLSGSTSNIPDNNIYDFPCDVFNPINKDKYSDHIHSKLDIESSSLKRKIILENEKLKELKDYLDIIANDYTELLANNNIIKAKNNSSKIKKKNYSKEYKER